MKKIAILLLIDLSFCAIQFDKIEPVSRVADLNENKKNGDFTVCTYCLRDEQCRNYIYEDLLNYLTDDYDKELAALQACTSLSGNPEFDKVVYDYLGRSNTPLLNRNTVPTEGNKPRIRLDIVDEDDPRLKTRAPQAISPKTVGRIIHVIIIIIEILFG